MLLFEGIRISTWTSEFHQNLVATGRVVPSGGILALFVVDEEDTSLQDHSRVKSGTDGHLDDEGASVEFERCAFCWVSLTSG